jgi:hypothetical protein
MNYTTLFPKILKSLPDISKDDLCYKYQKNSDNYNTNLKIYMPSGKKMLLWFVKYDNNLYSLLIELDNHTLKPVNVYFKYISFKRELTMKSGTIFWVTQVNNQLSINKIIYLYGNKYENRMIMRHMNEIKYVLDEKINQTSNTGLFLELRMPVMSNDKNYVYVATSLNYNVYNILSINNYSINLNEYSAVFDIYCVNHKRDHYKLTLGDQEYCSAYVNDLKTSSFLKKIFKINHQNYKSIEISDDESEESEIETTRVLCVYISSVRKWKPVKEVKHKKVDSTNRIKSIENKKYN